MSARAPQAIYNLWYAVQKAIPQAKLGGIVGDTAHSFGYHLARQDLGSGDYSVQLPADRLGASDCASALDVSLPPDLMTTCTARLLAAAKGHDPRLHALREFCGTLNGSDTYPWDLSNDTSEGVNSWDNSHLWHIHLSFYREFADNEAALLPIADVLAGNAQEDDMTPDQDTRLTAIYHAMSVIVNGDPKHPNSEAGLAARLARIEAEIQAIKEKVGA